MTRSKSVFEANALFVNKGASELNCSSPDLIFIYFLLSAKFGIIHVYLALLAVLNIHFSRPLKRPELLYIKI
jgi:hypothetical protein